MASLFANLNLGSGALFAHRAQISATGHNIANAETAGHTRAVVGLAAQETRPGGVMAGGRVGTNDNLLARREREASAESGRASDLARAMDGLESRLAEDSGGIVDAVAALFGGVRELAQAPSSLPRRRALVSEADALGAAFARASAAIAESRGDADARIVSYAENATRLSAEIARANTDLAKEYNSVTFDRRDQAARELSEIVGGAARIDPDGQMRFVLDDGAAIVQGELSASIRGVPDPGLGGMSRIEVQLGNNVRNVTAAVTDGKMGAQIDVRDNAGVQAANRLDQLAFDISSAVNAVHQSNAGLDGVSGRDFFVPIASVQGAAANLQVDTAISSDPSRIASAAPALGPSDNSGLLELAALGDQPLAGSGSRTFVNDAIDIIGEVGIKSRAAQDDLRISGSQMDLLAGIRDSASGVSIEDEMLRLSEFQRASEASMRFISTVDTLLDGLINRT